jgi:hypothetical protein
MGRIIFDETINAISQNKEYPLKIYPNPVLEFINIEATKIIQEWKLYNLQGQQMGTEVNIHLKSFKIPSDNLSKGIYILQLTDIEGRINSIQIEKD